jgi:EAL domain-containing protein (putative c-di-GMP-specific phosphodiesterase class I)
MTGEVCFAGGRITTVLQPVVRIADGAVVGLEALARLETQDGSVLAPAAFLDDALAAGLGPAIACAQARALAQAAPALLFGALNLSATDLARPGTVEEIVTAASNAGLEPGRLRVELTETDAADGAALAAGAARLHAAGAMLVLDDYGRGWNGAARVRELSPGGLKLDRSLTRGLDGCARARAIVSSIIALADALGIDLVAEGVETLGEANACAALGAAVGQGFHWARPVRSSAAWTPLVMVTSPGFG